MEEAGWFADKLNESGLAVDGLVVNRVHPAFGPRRAASRGPPGSALAGLIDNLRGYQAVNEREESAFADLVTQVAPSPVARVPLLDIDVTTSTDWAWWPTSCSTSAGIGEGRWSAESRAVSLSAVRTIVVASDAPSVRAEVVAVVGEPGTEVVEVNTGPAVVRPPSTTTSPTCVVVDLQMGNMGGMAVCLELRLEESYGNLPHVPVLMLLDRRADVFLARRSGAEGWVVKPLDPIRLRRATAALLAGGTYHDESFQPVPVLVAPVAALGGGSPAAAGA